MQSSVPKGLGGMVAVLGSEIETIEKIITDSKEVENNKDISNKDRYLLSYKISTLKEINL